MGSMAKPQPVLPAAHRGAGLSRWKISLSVSPALSVICFQIKIDHKKDVHVWNILKLHAHVCLGKNIMIYNCNMKYEDTLKIHGEL